MAQGQITSVASTSIGQVVSFLFPSRCKPSARGARNYELIPSPFECVLAQTVCEKKEAGQMVLLSKYSDPPDG